MLQKSDLHFRICLSGGRRTFKCGPRAFPIPTSGYQSTLPAMLMTCLLLRTSSFLYTIAKHYPLLRNGDKGFEIEIQGVEDPCKHKLNLYFVTSQGTFAPNGHFKLCFILLYCAHKINYTNQMLHLILLKQQTYTFSSYSKI